MQTIAIPKGSNIMCEKNGADFTCAIITRARARASEKILGKEHPDLFSNLKSIVESTSSSMESMRKAKIMAVATGIHDFLEKKGRQTFHVSRIGVSNGTGYSTGIFNTNDGRQYIGLILSKGMSQCKLDNEQLVCK